VRAIGAGSIVDPSLLAAVLGQILENHISRTLPQGRPERYGENLNGTFRVPAEPAPEWSPLVSDTTSRELAMVLSHLQDAIARPKDELAAKRSGKGG